MEQFVGGGLNPLGSQPLECVQVPAFSSTAVEEGLPKLFLLLKALLVLVVMNMTEMINKWDIANTVAAITNKPAQQKELMEAIEKEMEESMKRNNALNKNKRRGKFHRSTKLTEEIHQNYKEMNCLQMATKKGNFYHSPTKQTLKLGEICSVL